jgi:hypothetical protein
MAGGDHGGVRFGEIGGQLRPQPVPVTTPAALSDDPVRRLSAAAA